MVGLFTPLSNNLIHQNVTEILGQCMIGLPAVSQQQIAIEKLGYKS